MKKDTAPVLLTEGNLFKRIIAFAIPVMLTGMLQMFLTTVDNIVVGQFCGSDALAAIGCASPIVTLLLNVLIGLSTGTSVCTAQAIGSGNQRDAHETVHTAILTSLISGVIFGALGFAIAHPALILTECPDELMDGAATYLMIYFIGMPFSMFYNFGSAILRAVGDTRRPLYYMISSGVVNLILNLIFVIVFRWGIAGVAIATVISQLISAALICIYLVKSREVFKLELRKLKIYSQKLVRILRIGIPAGLQGSVFSVSNVVIQSSINSLGAAVVTGCSAAGNYEGFIATAMNSLAQTSVTFVAQHMGARKIKRMNRSVAICAALVVAVSVTLNGLALIFREPLLRVFIVDNPEAIREGILRMWVISLFHPFCGLLDVFMGSVQGLGASVSPTVVSLAGTCGLRLLWVSTVFRNAVENRALALYAVYPVSWIITLCAMIILFFVMRNSMLKKNGIISCD